MMKTKVCKAPIARDTNFTYSRGQQDPSGVDPEQDFSESSSESEAEEETADRRHVRNLLSI